MSPRIGDEATTMTHAHGLFAAAALATLSLSAGTALATAPAEAAAPPEATAWQHHHVTFNYFGITALYTCDGLEGKVGQILLFFGARRGLQVQANGCPRGPDSLSRFAWVTADFDTLAAAPPDTAAADIVQAQWTAFKLDGQRPFFMGEGDCELISAMKPMLTQNFTWRGLAYDTGCTPHQISLDDFQVRGEVLKSSAGHAG
jgi:hypothetical protein